MHRSEPTLFKYQDQWGSLVSVRMRRTEGNDKCAIRVDVAARAVSTVLVVVRGTDQESTCNNEDVAMSELTSRPFEQCPQ